MSAITIFQRTPKRLAAVLAMAGTLAAGVAGGYAARFAHLPLPWLLGALLTIMALSLAGAPPADPPLGSDATTGGPTRAAPLCSADSMVSRFRGALVGPVTRPSLEASKRPAGSVV